MKLGIIGCGLIGMKRAAAEASFSVVSAADLVRERAEGLCSRFGGTPSVDWRDVLAPTRILWSLPPRMINLPPSRWKRSKRASMSCWKNPEREKLLSWSRSPHGGRKKHMRQSRFQPPLSSVYTESQKNGRRRSSWPLDVYPRALRPWRAARL